ncbi:MAG: DUF2470 domain-containing protein [Bryobacteraceae bacterium]
MSDAPRKHNAPPMPASDTERPSVPESAYAERARTLLHQRDIGSLSTHSRRRTGYPFASVMPYALGPDGRPVFLISGMAMHTQNLMADPRASLLVTEAGDGADALGKARVTLVGDVTRIDDAERAAARDLYLEAQPSAKYWVDFEDFAFYRMEVLDLYYVGGFGVMGWIPAMEYAEARPDPLAGAAADIIGHMNADHADALLLLAEAYAEETADEAAMTSIDRLGFHVRLKSGDRVHGARIGFPRQVRTTQEARTVLVEMVRHARKKRD